MEIADQIKTPSETIIDCIEEHKKQIDMVQFGEVTFVLQDGQVRRVDRRITTVTK